MGPTDDELEGFVQELRQLDVVDIDAYDDDFFDGLADSVMARIEAGSTEARVVPMRRRKLAPALYVGLAAAAALALALLFGRAGPTDATAPIASTDEPAPLEDPEALGRELGRSVLAAALVADDDDAAEASELMATSWTGTALATDELEDDWYYGSTLMDDLDDLSADELSALAARL